MISPSATAIRVRTTPVTVGLKIRMIHARATINVPMMMALKARIFWVRIPSVVKIVSGLDPDGSILFWDYSVYSAGERGAAPCYDIANARFRSSGSGSYGPASAEPSVHPFAAGPWRGPGANMNVFAIESQIDMMAAASGQDSLAFRLRHLTDMRTRTVLQEAADAFGWKPAVSPSKRGFGVACSIDAGTYVATMAEVKVDPANGHVQVIRG